MIGVAMGINNLLEVFNEKYYENLEGGILESFGRLFRNAVKLYVYPMRETAFERYVVAANGAGPPAQSHAPNVLISAKNLRITDRLASLYAFLLENRCIECIVGFDSNILNIFSRDALQKIKDENPLWELMVPIPVVEAIKRRRLFGYEGHPAQ
jgi:hypothetical protein